jgi:hypothetical protein
MARHTPVIWVRFKQEYFFEGGWTGNRGARPSGKSVDAAIGKIPRFYQIQRPNDRGEPVPRHFISRMQSYFAVIHLANALLNSFVARPLTFSRNDRSWRCMGEPSGPNIFAALLA